MTTTALVRLNLITICIVVVGIISVTGQTLKVTLLGTGTPAPVMNRFGPSILVEAGDQKLIFDVGRGAIQRLNQVQVSYKDVQAVFFTHLHSDHVIGFPDLWLTGWINGRRDTPSKVFGPKGTAKMIGHLEQAFEYDIKIRLYDDKAPFDGVAIEAKDISEGVVYEKNGVKVTAFEVDHAPIKPAFGYRIDYNGRSAVLSGDTKYSENLIKHARGVDLLIHEVASLDLLKQTGRDPEWIKSIFDHHTSPEQAGEVFTKVKPRLAVFSHIVLPSAKEQDVIPQTRKTYSGPLELGEDLMVIEIGDKIEIRRAPKIDK